MFLSSSRDKLTLLWQTQWQMFLLVSGRHVGAHLGGHQHGVCIQISINFGKTFLRISSIRKIAVTLRGEKLNYKSVAKEISKPPFFGS